MSMTLSSMRIAVAMVFFSLSWSSLRTPSMYFMCATMLSDPRLHTAISLSLVLSVISVHRLELCTTPACCCGERRLQGSLKVIHGCPVSNSIDSILRHSCAAGSFLYSFNSPLATFSSYLRYAFSNARPCLSCRSGASEGLNSVQSPFSITRFMNRSGIQLAAIVAGVLAKLEELLDVEVPGLQVGANGSFALAALIHRHRGVVDDLEEGHDSLRLAVGSLDMGAQRPHRRP